VLHATPALTSKHTTAIHTAFWCAPHRTIFATNSAYCSGTGSPS